jgi:hypothetical protein
LEYIWYGELLNVSYLVGKKFYVYLFIYFKNLIKNNKVIQVLRLKQLEKVKMKSTMQGDNKKDWPVVEVGANKVNYGIVLSQCIVDFIFTFPIFLSLKGVYDRSPITIDTTMKKYC